MRVKNWQKLQPYNKKRNKETIFPWIKLYKSILNDRPICEISDKAFRVLILCWLVADEETGELPSVKDMAWAFRIKEKELNDLLPTISRWVIESDINSISNEYQPSLREEKRREEKRREGEEQNPDSSGNRIKPEDILNIWNSMVDKSLPRVQYLNSQRESRLKVQFKVMGDINEWMDWAKRINRSDFLCGRTDRYGEHAKWQCTFDWAIKSSSITKIMEGNYDNKRKTTGGRHPEKQVLGKHGGQVDKMPPVLGGAEPPKSKV